MEVSSRKNFLAETWGGVTLTEERWCSPHHLQTSNGTPASRPEKEAIPEAEVRR